MWMDVKEGKWIYEESKNPDTFIYFRERWVCSACGDYQMKSRGRTKFCPSCGAYMANNERSEQDEEVQIIEG